MANPFFISDFRGAGSPGAPGVGSTQRGLQLVEQGKLQLARQRAGQAGLIEQDQLALEAARRKGDLGGLALSRAQAGQTGLLAQDRLAFESAQRDFERDSLISGAEQLSVISSRPAQLANLERRNEEIIARGGNPEHTQEGIQLLKQGMQTGDFSEFDQSIQDILSLKGGQQKAGQASAKTEIMKDGTVIQALPDRTVEVRDPSGQIVTGQRRLDVLKASQQFGLETKEKEAEIAIERARGVAGATQREKRVSDIKTELSTRNRNAGRESVRLNQALKVAGSATQGVKGAAKLQLAKLFPDIDVGNEALLDQTLKQLAIDQLQNFKGPTTDFEFGQVEATTGAIGDPRTANIARLKSLQRANWFNRREFEQFNRHAKSGGDPDTFAFNFGEPVKTKKGVFTLQQIQDTAVSNNLSVEETLKRLNK